MATSLTLGNFSFEDFEVPESIDGFGGYQATTVHNFPGGNREVQTWGYFPDDVISWSGFFWQDGSGTNGLVAQDIFDRMQQIQDMIKLGQPVALSFSRFSYNVIPYKIVFSPRLEKMIPYHIMLIPLTDQHNPPGPPTAPPINQLNAIVNNMGTAPGSPLTPPPPPTNNPLVNSGNPNIVQANPVSIPNPVPANVASALTSFQKSLLSGIQNALGQISQVNTPALQSQLNQTQALVAPLANSSDSGLSAFGLNTDASLTQINGLLNPTSAPLATVNAVNPSLTDLALQWYGTADEWEAIAQANDIQPPIPNPIGIFSQDNGNALIIPALS